jgi:hypothetical protein
MSSIPYLADDGSRDRALRMARPGIGEMWWSWANGCVEDEYGEVSSVAGESAVDSDVV